MKALHDLGQVGVSLDMNIETFRQHEQPIG